MKGYWAQPSLFRDFTLLSAAVVFILILLTSLVAYTTYSRFSERIVGELEKESLRIERTLASEMQNANYMLTALGRQIVLDNDRDLTKLARVLKSFDSSGYIYTIFSWVSTEQMVVVSSNKGVLDKPVDISDRDYVKKSLAEPWRMHIGRPIEGRVSGRWVIPVAMGVTDYTGKFIGTIMISIDINNLTDKLSNLVKREGLGFAIISKTLLTLTQVSDDKDFVSNNFPNQTLINVDFAKHPTGLLATGSLFFGDNNYSYYRVSSDYPYIILLSYDSHYSSETLRGMLWSRVFQLIMIALFLVMFLWIMRTRMIKPVLRLSDMASAVARGDTSMQALTQGPEEIQELSRQIRRVGDYIDESRRIEKELRNKLFMLKGGKESAELNMRGKAEFLAYSCQEMLSPLNNVVGFAQVMRDQLYGPIENRKYRQYVSDIYQIGNTLLTRLQDLLTFARVETNYIELSEKTVDVSGAVHKALQFINDRMQADKISAKVRLQDPLPQLMADELRLQQIITNALLYVVQHMLPSATLTVHALVVHENKDRQFFAIVIRNDELSPGTPQELAARAEQCLKTEHRREQPEDEAALAATRHLNLELARTLAALHNGCLDCRQSDKGVITLAVFFPGNRIRFVDSNQ
jgi:signal transduction histidine kinase